LSSSPSSLFFSHPYRIHPERKHSSLRCLLPPARSFFLIHIEIHPETKSLISSQLSSSPAYSFLSQNSSRKNIHLPIVFFLSSLFLRQ
jgi:hypothetical protein